MIARVGRRRAGLVYNAVVGVLRLTTRVFFRTIEVVGLENVPDDGPVVFVGNHPNSLMDPALIITTCERRVSFAAKDVLFRSRLLRPVLRSLGAVPIRRRMDHGGAADNSEAFAALLEVLRSGGAFGIFPEGISHTRSELAPLKTGAARIALTATREGIPVRIIPCGLTYVHRTRARSRVLVQFGAAIEPSEAPPAAGDGEEWFRATARALTESIDASLRGLTINAADFTTLRVLDQIRRLYRPTGMQLTLAERAELSRRFIDHFERFQAEPDVAALFADVARYADALEALGLHDRDLRRHASSGARVVRVLRHFVLLLFFVPLAVPGALLHAPILVLAAVAGNSFTRRKDVIATTKMVTALSLVLLGYVAVAAVIVWRVAFPALLWALPLSLATLVLSAWATLRVLEREAAVRRGVSVTVALLRFARELARLRAEREALRARLLEVADRYVDPELVRVIPRTAHGDDD
ncbi:MAG: lysophospholipid acyltransferase family protein [Nannocystaceae bacterium]